MVNPLSSKSFMECQIHGFRRPAFICKHLQDGVGIGFVIPGEVPTSDEPWQMAWCNQCEDIRQQEGEWNDVSEKFAGVMVICEGCFESIRLRNI